MFFGLDFSIILTAWHSCYSWGVGGSFQSNHKVLKQSTYREFIIKLFCLWQYETLYNVDLLDLTKNFTQHSLVCLWQAAVEKAPCLSCRPGALWILNRYQRWHVGPSSTSIPNKSPSVFGFCTGNTVVTGGLLGESRWGRWRHWSALGKLSRPGK